MIVLHFLYQPTNELLPKSTGSVVMTLNEENDIQNMLNHVLQNE